MWRSLRPVFYGLLSMRVQGHECLTSDDSSLVVLRLFEDVPGENKTSVEAVEARPSEYLSTERVVKHPGTSKGSLIDRCYSLEECEKHCSERKDCHSFVFSDCFCYFKDRCLTGSEELVETGHADAKFRSFYQPCGSQERSAAMHQVTLMENRYCTNFAAPDTKDQQSLHRARDDECIDFCVANANDCQGIVILPEDVSSGTYGLCWMCLKSMGSLHWIHAPNYKAWSVHPKGG